MVGGFVEQQKVCRMHQHAQQGVAIALSAGEHADAFENVVGGKQKASEQAAQFGLRGTRRKFAEIVENARVGIEFLVLVLREVIGLDVVSEFVLAFGKRFRAAASNLIRVDLPAPLTPTSAMRSPRSIIKLTSLKTCFSP